MKVYTELSILRSSCLFGVDVINRKLDEILKELVRNPCDPLDDRRLFFEDAYEIYNAKIEELKNEIVVFFNDTIALCPDVSSALIMLDR